MKNKLLYLVILLLSYNTTISQTLHLQDQQTLEPIPFANISTKQLLISEGKNTTYRDSILIGTTTCINGLADLSRFADNVLIEISFIGYETRRITKNEMAKKDYVILLAQSSEYLEDDQIWYKSIKSFGIELENLSTLSGQA